jgi:hypothetical protein
MTANAMLSVALEAEIMLSGFSFSDLWQIRLRYGKLTKVVSYCCSNFCSFAAELSDTVVDLPISYYHSTTIHCRDLPRFAGFARFSGRNVRVFPVCKSRQNVAL